MKLIIKLCLWGVIIENLLVISFAFSEAEPIYLAVKPAYSTEQTKQISTYPEANVYSLGKMEIAKPTVFQRLVYPDTFYHFDTINGLYWLILAVTILIMISKIETNAPFTYNLAPIFRVIAFALILHYVADATRGYLAAKEVSRLTNENYSLLYSRGNNRLEIWFGIILIWFSRSYKKAMQLQKEEALTI